jgi:type III pantothenate kinase
MIPMTETWLALAIGNSRLHWAWFVGSKLHQTWNTAHLFPEAIATLITNHFDFTPYLKSSPKFPLPDQPQLWIASVVPEQTAYWQIYNYVHVITLDHLPLQGTYPTLGLDRALALWGAIKTLGTPVLVIDAGTALTFTGADRGGRFAGGAILPGMQLQMRSLFHNTAALPLLESNSLTSIPPRWASNTPDSIRSGILYATLAALQDFVEAWLQEFPQSAVALTGGDSALLYTYLKQLSPQLAVNLTLDPHLIFWGIQAIHFTQGLTTPFNSS